MATLDTTGLRLPGDCEGASTGLWEGFFMYSMPAARQNKSFFQKRHSNSRNFLAE
jgi:hypothetical protein